MATSDAADKQIGPFSLEPVVNYTSPDPLTYHPVTEEQINTLCQGSNDQSLNIMYCAVGAAAGLLQNVFDVYSALSADKAPTGKDVTLALICFACMAVAGSKFSEWWRHKPQNDELRRKILSRTVSGRS